ncbi:MAG: endolytic transglycosylase MltG [Candidatus Jacksonbacteria bacterium]|nr:endolytic transglycosylase MltG [Candidatus Jacksonbacteria bacterium]
MIPENTTIVKQAFFHRLKKVFTSPGIILSAFLALVLLAVLATVWLVYRAVDLPEPNIYEIVPGATSREIAYDLARKHIIRSPDIFNLYLSLKNMDTQLQAGRYEFPEPRMSLREIAAFLTSGAKAKEVEFTVPEGFTLEQIAALLQGKGFFNFLSKGGSASGGQFSNLEGYLFPDTYRVYENSDSGDIIEKMFRNFEKKVVLPFASEIENSGRTLPEIITMASILEKEVQTEEDMKKAADVLWRRLDADWGLEVDSTLKYEIGGANPSLTYDELKIDSPYNTYKYKGFPPTPIGNPGLKAIMAAIYPEPNDYWFYLSKPDGETVFSKTLQEHNFNKAKYLK